MQNGGARPGAGRKPKAEQFKVPIAKAEKKIVDHLPAILDNMFALAKGVSVLGSNSAGEEVVYVKPPDYKANEYLLNRIMGKPTERQEVTGEGGNDFVIRVIRTGDFDKVPEA